MPPTLDCVPCLIDSTTHPFIYSSAAAGGGGCWQVANAAKKPIVVFVMTGGAVDLTHIKANPKVAAVVWCGYPGQSGGQVRAVGIGSEGGECLCVCVSVSVSVSVSVIYRGAEACMHAHTRTRTRTHIHLTMTRRQWQMLLSGPSTLAGDCHTPSTRLAL